jgi:4-hydroxy-tetrahydrodipicolinate synthase
VLVRNNDDPEKAMKYPRREAKKYARKHMKGVWAAIPYPFTEDGELDEPELRKDVRRYVDDLKIDGMFIGGLVGEVWSLTMEERYRGQHIVLDEVNGATQIIAHTVAASIRETVALTQHAQRFGADFAIMANPPLNSRHPDVTRTFFEAVCAETDLGVGLFNTPISGYALTPQQIADIAEINNIICVKDAQPAAHIIETRKLAGDKIVVCDPLESNLLENMLYYGDQVHMSSPAPYLFQTPGSTPIRDYYLAAAAGREEEARRIWLGLSRVRVVEQKWINAPWSLGFLPKAAVKAWSEMLGLAGGNPRPPIKPLSKTQKAELRRDLIWAGLLEKVAAAAE